MARRQSVGSNIDQFSHFANTPPVTAGEEREERPDLRAVAPESPESDSLADVDELLGRTSGDSPHPEVVRAPRPRAKGARRADIILPDKLMSDLRELGRPERTGAPRTIGAKFFAACYVRAVHELVGDRLDTGGLDGLSEDETIERVKRALLDRSA